MIELPFKNQSARCLLVASSSVTQSAKAGRDHQGTSSEVNQRTPRYPRSIDQLYRSVANEPNHERGREKENCSYSKSKMGEATKREICPFSPTRFQGEEEDNEPRSQSEVVG